MFKRFKELHFERQALADELDDDEICKDLSPSPGFGCTLNPDHEDTHLAGTGGGCAIAEWDDDRETD